MIDDLTRTILEERDNIENLRNRELNSNREAYIKQLEQENEQLKDRINKAVEYLNEWGKEPDADMYMFIRDYKEFKHLLDLLKGDKE